MRLDDISSKISKWVTDKFPNINFEWYGKYCQNVYTPIRGGLQEKDTAKVDNYRWKKVFVQEERGKYWTY